MDTDNSFMVLCFRISLELLVNVVFTLFENIAPFHYNLITSNMCLTILWQQNIDQHRYDATSVLLLAAVAVTVSVDFSNKISKAHLTTLAFS